MMRTDERQIINSVIDSLKGKRFMLTDEKKLQQHLYDVLLPVLGERLKREYSMDDTRKDIIDFFVDGVGIEIKIKGSKREIYRQCERYCVHEKLKSLILVTNIAMGFPAQILNKDCYVIKLGRAWL